MADAGASARHPHRGPRVTQAEHRTRALCEMFDLRLTEEDLVRLLGGGCPTEVVVPRRDEKSGEYGRRAASEIMVRYILK
ncbi:hypothetical protein [uncultured Methylobacterium sp.]|uniref:hypothetical protein n=1 Tax=uncultured Methylobacterium sp. TaxID=157278 RepID=UPI002595008B|nr:hypothetical protein [uncultured Methylobacterium sp.]